MMTELREAAPAAPDSLRERVHELREPQPGRAWRLRPALIAAVAILVAVGVSAATIGGLTGSTAPKQKSLVQFEEHGSSAGSSDDGVTILSPEDSSLQYRGDPGSALSKDRRSFSPSADAAKQAALPPGQRLQRFDVAMGLRVRDLSRATQTAVRETRRLGGYVAAADYSTGNNVGDSSLKVRVPVGRLQQAIARFNDLGTLLSQHIVVADLKAPLDRTEARITTLRKVIAELEAKSSLTPAEQFKLDRAKRAVHRLSQTATRLIREGSFARVSLQLTTRKAAAQHAEPGRFDNFLGDAGEILGKEAIAVLYALVIAGPFLILAALALLAERARRRRADHRLLGEAG
jgi:hypothetical protein